MEPLSSLPEARVARVELPRLVLFDVGNVLVSLRPWGEALPWVGSVAPRAEAVRAFRDSEAYRGYELGSVTTAEFCAAARRFFDSDLTDAEISARYGRLLGEEVSGMLDLVRDLKRRGVRTAGLSDTCPIHAELLSSYSVVRELETVYASCDTGRTKPETAAYLHALDRSGVAPADAFFTDDLEPNVAGARRAGIAAEVFRGASDLRRRLGLDRAPP
jgi:putative hydrolase of the HAD superfamily